MSLVEGDKSDIKYCKSNGNCNVTQVGACMNGFMNGFMNGCMDGWMNG